jgi:lipopolysaccharide/colanic/teichoic acid biosynthesis glycosyltransferase
VLYQNVQTILATPATESGRRQSEKREEALVVGLGALGHYTGIEIQERRGLTRIRGYLHFTGEQTDRDLPADVLGSVGDLEHVLRKHVVDKVFFAGHSESHRAEMQEAIEILEQFGIPFALPATGFRFGRARPAHERSVADGYIGYSSVPRKPLQQALKRSADVAASLLALAFVAPLLAVVAGILKLSSAGPVLVKEIRIGQRGRAFDLLSFRSAGGGSIDRLPRLLNVLRGDMSVIGPRPALPSEVESYEPWQHRRLSVRPGLIGPSPAKGAARAAAGDALASDVRFVDHWSLRADVATLWRAVSEALTGWRANRSGGARAASVARFQSRKQPRTQP